MRAGRGWGVGRGHARRCAGAGVMGADLETLGARGWRGFGKRTARGVAAARGGAAAGAGAGFACWVAGGGCTRRAPERQAVNISPRVVMRRFRASQSRNVSNTLLPVCRARAVRVLRWPDAMWARDIITIGVFICDACIVGKEKMLGVRFFLAAASARRWWGAEVHPTLLVCS